MCPVCANGGRVVGVTFSPATPPHRRIVVTVLIAALLVALGLMALDELGVGPSIVPFVLAAIALVDAEQVRRRWVRQSERGR